MCMLGGNVSIPDVGNACNRLESGVKNPSGLDTGTRTRPLSGGQLSSCGNHRQTNAEADRLAISIESFAPTTAFLAFRRSVAVWSYLPNKKPWILPSTPPFDTARQTRTMMNSFCSPRIRCCVWLQSPPNQAFRQLAS